MHPSAEQCRSLSSKDLAVEEALVPAAANADAKPMEPALFGEEVAPERQEAIGQEREVEAVQCSCWTRVETIVNSQSLQSPSPEIGSTNECNRLVSIDRLVRAIPHFMSRSD